MPIHSMPRWGIVTAAPHEVLVHLRGGRVLRNQQGGSCFMWPGDTVARVDTSVHRLMFTADQVTREKTGVQVTGLAVFRIVEPLLAYRMIDLQDEGRLPEILREMLLGATRRLVANLTLEQCLTRRKDALATELLAEVAPVVSGTGRPEDGTDQGWGVAIDTIEVQDVRVLSEEVFSRLQAAYREELALGALQARAEVQRAEALLEEERALRAEERRRELMALEEARLEAERDREQRKLTHEQGLADTTLQARMRRENDKQQHDLSLHRRGVEARIASDQLGAEAEDARAEARAASEVRVAEQTARAEQLLGEARAELERLARAARDTVSDARLREVLLTETLPAVAQAQRESFDKIVVTGASDLSVLGAGVSQVVASLQAFGFGLPGASSD